MAHKNLIIGGFTNYEINQLKPWVISAKEYKGYGDDIVLAVGNTTKETIDWLKEEGVIIVPMAAMDGVPIHVLRFISIYSYLKDNWKKYDYVVTTDVKDVYFQYSPFVVFNSPQYKENNYKLIIASEGLKYKDEPWGNENLMQTYGPYIYEQFKENEIFNVGTFGGDSEYVKDMVFHIFTNAINRPIPICDQAVFNILINTQPFKDVVYRSNDWAAELGTVMDPSKIEQFKPNLLFAQPIWMGADVLIPPAGLTFPIVHQYDRVPELKKYIQEKYLQEKEQEFFTYRV